MTLFSSRLRMNFLQELFFFDVRPLPKRRLGSADPALTAEARRLLLAIGEWELASKVKVEWYPRLRSTAGLAVYRDQMVYLNPKLVRFAPAEPIHTLKHELAHLVARARAGRRRIDAHGPEWRRACVDLGIPGERPTHNLPLPRSNRPRPYVYRCLHCQGEVKRTKPFRFCCACYACCRKHSGGRFDERFRYVRVRETVEA
jgi:predicted SprT family Zn-dependent metalloprotease